MTQKIKLQHYVPRFYLQSFGAQGGDANPYCFDKSECKSFKGKNIACESYFYDISEDGDQVVETGFSYLESLFKYSYDKLVSTQDLCRLNSEEKKVMAYFVATQLVRTKENREAYRDFYRQVIETLSKGNLPKESREQLKLQFAITEEEVALQSSVTEEELKTVHIGMLQFVPYCVDKFSRMKWVLNINSFTMPYWSSDNPVTRSNPIDHWPYNSVSLSRKGIQVHLPLSPVLSLCICDPVMYNYLPSNFEITDVQSVKSANYLQVYWSTRYVFSNKNDFSFAEAIIQKNPTLADPKRNRFRVLPLS